MSLLRLTHPRKLTQREIDQAVQRIMSALQQRLDSQK